MPDMAPPATLPSRPIYQGRILTVTVDRVRLPHGPDQCTAGAYQITGFAK